MTVYTYANGFAVGLSINKLPADIDFFNIGGIFTPYFGSQTTQDKTVLEVETNKTPIQRIRLKFNSTPVANKQLPTGKFEISYYNGSTWTTEDLLTTIELNHARNFHPGDET